MGFIFPIFFFDFNLSYNKLLICCSFLCRQERTKEARPTSFSANSCFEIGEMEKAQFQEFRSNSWDIYAKGKVCHNSDIFFYI